MATTPRDKETPDQASELKSGDIFSLGSQGVIGIKIGAAVLGILVLIWYIVFLSYSESPYWLVGIIFGVIALGIGIAGIFIGNLKISRKKYVPSLNIILIMLSIFFLLAMPIFGSWEDPNTIGEALWNVNNMVLVLIFGIFILCYIELAHASIRFSEIDDYATSHNIRDFNVNSVINNYFIWFGILMAIIFIISLSVLLLQLGLSGYIKDVAPQFGYSLEYNSVISVLISIALVFVPIGLVLTFVFGYFVKSRRSIVVKSKEDIVARAPDAVQVK